MEVFWTPEWSEKCLLRDLKPPFSCKTFYFDFWSVLCYVVSWISVINPITNSSFEVEWTEFAGDKSSLSSLCFSLSEFAMFYIRANFRFFLCCNKVSCRQSLCRSSAICVCCALLCILIMENTKKRNNSLSPWKYLLPCTDWAWTQQRQSLHCHTIKLL